MNEKLLKKINKIAQRFFSLLVLGGVFLASMFFVWNGFNTMGWILFVLFVVILIEHHYVEWFNNTHRKNQITGKYHKVSK